MNFSNFIARRLLEADEEDFDLVGEINSLPTIVHSIQRFDSVRDDEGDLCSSDPREPVEIHLDTYDQDQGWDVIDLTVAYLLNEGALYASASNFHPGVWYVSNSRLKNDGTYEESTWHLLDFDEEEEAQVFERFHRAL